MKVVSSDIPPLKGLRKDHKKVMDPSLGPPNRPFLNAGIGPNANLANLQARILRPVRTVLNSEIGTEVCSTEEVKRAFEECNLKPLIPHPIRPNRACKSAHVPLQANNRVVGSMDVGALYLN